MTLARRNKGTVIEACRLYVAPILLMRRESIHWHSNNLPRVQISPSGNRRPNLYTKRSP
jgi:hypothetical protein